MRFAESGADRFNKSRACPGAGHEWQSHPIIYVLIECKRDESVLASDDRIIRQAGIADHRGERASGVRFIKRHERVHPV